MMLTLSAKLRLSHCGNNGAVTIQRLLNARPLCRVSLSASFRAASAGRFSSEAPVLSVEDDRGRTAIKDGGVSAVYRTGFGIGHRGYQFVFQVLVKRVRQQLTTAIASAGNSLAEPPLITGSANRKQTLCYNNLRNLERSRERQHGVDRMKEIPIIQPRAGAFAAK